MTGIFVIGTALTLFQGAIDFTCGKFSYPYCLNRTIPYNLKYFVIRWQEDFGNFKFFSPKRQRLVAIIVLRQCLFIGTVTDYTFCKDDLKDVNALFLTIMLSLRSNQSALSLELHQFLEIPRSFACCIQP